jgi:predicted nucleotidyltransferase
MVDAADILRVLAEHRVEHVVVGALAATMQGSPLRTEDVDICPSRSEVNLARLASALLQLEAREWDVSRGEEVERVWSAEFLASDRVWILMTRSGRLDLIFVPAGSTGFDELDGRAAELAIDDLIVRVASLEDIIRSKETLGRERDLAQLPTLRRLSEIRRRLSSEE